MKGPFVTLLAVVLLGCGRVHFGPIDEASDGDGATVVPNRVDVILYASLSNCVIGDNCGAGCFAIEDDAGTQVDTFAKNANLAIVAPGDPRILTAALSRCLTTQLDANELAALHAELALFEANVEAWSRGSIRLDIRIHEVTVDSAMHIYQQDTPWISPAEVNVGLLSSDTDSILVTNDVRDDATGLHLPYGLCGLSFGADNGAAGSGLSWIPHTLMPGECANGDGYTHQWMNHLTFAVRNMSGFTDVYRGAYPPCGTGGDPATWFPSPSDCMRDPDWSGCGLTSCATGFKQHILEAHWPVGRTYIGNHCRDGVMDYGETGVDVGGVCI